MNKNFPYQKNETLHLYREQWEVDILWSDSKDSRI